MNDATSRTLFGVGVGPGDPELVTVKTVRILREADVILVPYTEATTDGPGRAESIITAVAPDIAGRIRRIPFSMRERSGVGEKRKASWQVSSDAVVTAFDEGARTVALATVGDPTVFSTFTYLRANVEERLPDVTVELSPGITAMQALSAASGRPLVEGKEILALVPATVGIANLGRSSTSLTRLRSTRADVNSPTSSSSCAAGTVRLSSAPTSPWNPSRSSPLTKWLTRRLCRISRPS